MKTLTTMFILGALAGACSGSDDSTEDTEGAARQSDDESAATADDSADEEPSAADDDPASDDETASNDEAETDDETETNDDVATSDEAISPGSGSTSLGAPAPCGSDDECPEGIECLKLDESDELGYCDVSDTVVTPEEPSQGDAGAPVEEASSGGEVSLAAPAICASDDECPPGIACLKLAESDAFGSCDVNEVAVE